MGWINNIATYLQSYYIEITHIRNEKNQIARNKSIIDYTIEYSHKFYRSSWKIQMNRINKVRLFKKAYLLFELVGIDRGKTTNVYHNDYELSSIGWNFHTKEEYSNPTDLEMRIWINFKKWLRNQEIFTTINFNKYCK